MPQTLRGFRRPLVRLGDNEIGYCMDPLRRDDCLQAAVATVTQIPVDQVPDARLDERLRAGDDPERIDRDSWEQLATWLHHRGLEAYLHNKVPIYRDRWIGVSGGVTKDEVASIADNLNTSFVETPFLDHCLVMSHRRIIFDPGISLCPPPGLQLRNWEVDDIDYGISIKPKE